MAQRNAAELASTPPRPLPSLHLADPASTLHRTYVDELPPSPTCLYRNERAMKMYTTRVSAMSTAIILRRWLAGGPIHLGAAGAVC